MWRPHGDALARVNGTTKSGRTHVVSIDDETVAELRQRRTDQVAEQLAAGDSWRATKDGDVFTTGWPVFAKKRGQGQQAILRRFRDLGHRHRYLLRHGELPRRPVRLGTAAVLLLGVAHGGPLPSSDDLAVARHLPLGKPRAGDSHSQVL
jgi:hypothetical protein